MQPTVASVSRQLFSVQDTAIHYLFPKHTEMSLNFLSDFLQEACLHQTLCYILSASLHLRMWNWDPVSSTVGPWCLKQAMNVVGPLWMCSGWGSTEFFSGAAGCHGALLGVVYKGWSITCWRPLSYSASVSQLGSLNRPEKALLWLVHSLSTKACTSQAEDKQVGIRTQILMALFPPPTSLQVSLRKPIPRSPVANLSIL